MKSPFSLSVLMLSVSLLTAGSAHATIINLQAAGVTGTGPTFAGAGNAETLTLTAGGYEVVLSGGTPLGPGIANLPASNSILYGTNDNYTASAGEIGYTNPLTVSFLNPTTMAPASVTNFFIDLYNGNTVPVDYTIASNTGAAMTFLIAPNFSSGQHVFGLPTGGTTFSILAGPAPGGCCGYDFFINGIGFNQAQVSGVPLPSAAPMFGTALLALGAIGYGLKRKGEAAA